jgi:excisionase family DNA binding protein
MQPEVFPVSLIHKNLKESIFMEYLSITEAAAVLRLSVSRVRQLATEGKIKSLQLQPRGRLLFQRADLELALRPKVGTLLQQTAGVDDGTACGVVA